MQKSILFFIAAFFFVPAKAQYEEKDFIHYTVKDGLSENYVTCVQQDERGYMWIGTDIGLNRFDGHSFKHFFKDTKTLPLLSGSIRRLKILGSHKLGIITRSGFQLLNTQNLSVENFVIPDTSAFSVYHNAAWDAVELPGGSYAVTTASGFYVFDAAGKPGFSHDAFSLKDIGQKRILYGREIYRMNDTEYLVFVNANELAYFNASNRSFKEISADQKKWGLFYNAAQNFNKGPVYRFQLSTREFIFIDFSNKHLLYYNSDLNKTVISPFRLPATEFSWESRLTIMNDSTFFVNAGYTGFYRFHVNRSTGKIAVHENKMLTSHKIQCLYIDTEKRLWAGTSKGLLKQKLATPVIHSISYQSAAADFITGGLSCAYRHGNKLYLARNALDKGFIIADTMGKILKQIEFYGSHSKWNEISSIQMYHADTLWIGTIAGILWFDVLNEQYGKLSDEKKYANGLTGLNILAPAAKDGYAWMCAYLNGRLARYHIATRTFTLFTSTTQPALPFKRIKSISYDAYGDVWIAGHSLARWNNKKQNFDTLLSVYAGLNKYEDDILTMVADNKGSLWLHNAFNGLLEYRIKEKRFLSYTKQDGLPSDAIYGLSPVINNQLWLAGNNNLTKFDTDTKAVVVYDYQDGLPEEKPSSRYLYYDSVQCKLYMFNQHLLATMSLPETQNSNYSGNLVIEELTVNNTDHFFYPGSGLQLKPNQNNLSLHFGIINFESGNKFQFAYKLNDKDNWTDLGGQRNINLTALPPGNYTIWLKGTGKSGVQKIEKFSFVIDPPYWKTTWFLLALLLAAVLSLYYFYRNRIKKISERASIDKQLLQAEMKALHAQMNPHFIFNSLNSIREMVLNNETKEASHFLSKFAQLIRMTLDQSGQTFISLRNTIDYLKRYAEMEQVRNSHFTFSILIDEKLNRDEIVLPPMLIQPFIENAIWHGTTGTQKNINIRVDFKRQQNLMVCLIDDDGIGVEQSLKNKKENDSAMHQSVGIANIKNRIRLLNEKYKMQCNINIEDKSNMPGNIQKGTLVTLQLPIEITGYE